MYVKSALIMTGVFAAVCADADSTARVELAVDTDFSYSYATQAHRSLQAEVEIEPAVEITLTEKLSFSGSMRVRLDQRDALEPGRHQLDSYTRISKPIALGNAGTAELRDFFWEFRSARGLTRLGKQQIVWGRLDGLKVLDLVNPQDFREFIFDDFSDSRISLWSAYFDYSFGKWRTELAIVPDASGHVIPQRGAWYALTAPRFRFGSAQASGTLPVLTQRPGISSSEVAIGLRATRQLASAQFSLVAYSGVDPEPLGRFSASNGQTVLAKYYERRDALGFSFDLGLGAFVIRAEYAFQPDRTFNTRATTQLGVTERDQHRGAVGLDVDGPLGVFINLQYLVDTVADAPSTLVRPATDRLATLYLRRQFAYDTLALEARLYRSLSDHDHVAAIKLAYAMTDSTTLEIAAQQASGNTSGLFGQFADRDRVTVSLKHTF